MFHHFHHPGVRLGQRPVGPSFPPLFSLFIVAVFLSLLLTAHPVRAEKLTLNLKGADINTLIETVSEATGRNFIIDPKVKGKVTVVSSRPMSKEELYQVFLAILEVHGFIAVPGDNVVKIVPDNKLKYSGTSLVPGSAAETVDGDEVVVRVFDIKHVDAARLLPVLRPLVSPKGHLAAYGDGNMLVVSDYAHSIKRLKRILRRVDQPLTGEIEVISLEHASASELSRVVGNMLKSGGRRGPKNAAPALVADDRSNSLLVGGDRVTRLRLRAIIAHLDIPITSTGNTRVIHLRFANAKELAGVLTSMGEHFLRSDKKGNATANSIVNVQAYEESNALVITAPPTLLTSMQEVIRRLDLRRAQVQVEAIIAEVSFGSLDKLGVDWGVFGARDNIQGMVGGTNFPDNEQSYPGFFPVGGALLQGVTEGKVEAAKALGSQLEGYTGLLAGFGGRISGTEFLGLLRAIKSDVSNNLLSTPTLITLDNQEAEIIVGNEVPFVTGQYSNDSGTPNPFQTIKREKVGLLLKVTPQINEGETVRMDITQEVSSLAENTFGARDVVTQSRSIKTSVLVDNGNILVLGGLIENNAKQTFYKVPLFGDLPLLGTLFRTQKASEDRTNLMVFLRPTIIRNAEIGRVLTHKKYGFVKEQQLSVSRPRWPYPGIENPPLLPEWMPPPVKGMSTTMAPQWSEPKKTLPPRMRPGMKTRAKPVPKWKQRAVAKKPPARKAFTTVPDLSRKSPPSLPTMSEEKDYAD